MKKLIIFPLGFLCILFIYTFYLPVKSLEYRVTHKKNADDILYFNKIDKKKVIEIRSLDNNSEGYILIISETST